MIVIGAGGLAKQLVSFEGANVFQNWVFYDDVNDDKLFLDRFKVVDNEEDVRTLFEHDNKYLIALSGYENKSTFRQRFDAMGGELEIFISSNAHVSPIDCLIGQGTIVLSGALIEPSVRIGECCLINVSAKVTHDCRIGNFTEIAPGAVCLGRAKIGNNCLIGANATILPNVEIGDDVCVGAGAVVIHDIESGRTVKGVPAV